MAVTYTVHPDNALRTFDLPHGIKVAHVRATISANTDYTVGTGFPFNTDRRLFGFTSIWAVFGATARQSNNTIRPLVSLWDYSAKGLRFFEQEAAAPLGEAEQADFAANDIIDFIVIGT